MAPLITLLTDFGLRDPFVGQMRGVMLTRCPNARFVDLTHDVPAQDLAAAAFYLQHSVACFPAGTVHLVVVDPGVGTERAAVVVRARDQLFVAPDNGVLIPTVGAQAPARRIDWQQLGLDAPGHTFHGRDLFAPTAALLAARSVSFEEVGPAHTLLAASPLRPPRREKDMLIGEVVVADHFGNLISNIAKGDLPKDPVVRVRSRAAAPVPYLRTYGLADPGQLLALVSSFDTLEIACREGSAAAALDAGPGTPVFVETS